MALQQPRSPSLQPTRGLKRPAEIEQKIAATDEKIKIKNRASKAGEARVNLFTRVNARALNKSSVINVMSQTFKTQRGPLQSRFSTFQ